MDVLVDDCLLHIFGFLNPIDWASASRVCTRWNKVLTNKWKSLTEIRFVKRYMINSIVTNYNNMDMALVLQYAGPFITSIDLCDYSLLEHAIQIGRFYYVPYNCPKIECLITMITAFCTNLSTITLHGSVGHLTDLFQANRKVKIINLLENGNLKEMFREIHSMDMVEEVNVLCSYRHTTCFNWCFPNVQILCFTILAHTFWQAQEVINKILVASPKLKKLKLIVFSERNFDREYYICKALSHIAACTSIEEVRIVVRGALDVNLSFENDAISKIISVCRDLRVVQLDHVGLGNWTGIDALLALPKLEELYVNVVKKFACTFLLPLNHLTKLTLKFDQNCMLTFSTLCKAIEKMPGLLHLRVAGLSGKQTLDLTCKAMACGIAQGRNVVIETQPINGTHRFLKVTNNDLNKPINFHETRSQILKLFITTPSEGYCDSIYKFVESSFQHFNISQNSQLMYELGDSDEEWNINFADFMMPDDELHSSSTNDLFDESQFSSINDSSDDESQSFDEDEEDEYEDYENEEDYKDEEEGEDGDNDLDV